MQKISTLFIILALMVVNIASVVDVHAACFVGNNGDITQNSVISDPDSEVPSNQLVQCQQCFCNSNSHITISNVNAVNYDIPSVKYFMTTNYIYSSALASPPFQPPKV